jgi:hypothetical protein
MNKYFMPKPTMHNLNMTKINMNEEICLKSKQLK